ncbi:MAG: ethanolamine ammonia-lyase reactivating factor EutA [Bacteroidetes bacterium]|nr:ethanolamine ammonia-lyase reactivating factor EutA [Bacteroidota bacterium]MBK9798744.1 ethanolamine ammonia-lyase reactivating factor EutA [Bacteroidota bacterium]MBP6412689.1 ethanolamine ammonia-lyase reactivating factor EutA [Bacteroidia bacterium]
MKFASIDIGSNAVRLLLCSVIEDGNEVLFKKNELVRIPLRLGEDAFITKKISEDKIVQLVKTMHAFRLLIEVFGALDYRACATSAMREATNGSEIIERVKNEAGITIEIIHGKTEAEIIYSNHIAEHLDLNSSYLYIDVGGGSTELTLFSKGKIEFSQSFNIGTIRLLHDKVSKEHWSDFKETVRNITKNYRPLKAIGSGGNINKLYKTLKKKEGKSLQYDKIKEYSEYLSTFSLDERIVKLGLNPDRADVILPASKIFLSVMKNAGIDEIIVPQIGLSDGIIHLLYEKHINEKVQL